MDNRATNVHDLLSLKIRVIDWKIVNSDRTNHSSSTELVKFKSSGSIRSITTKRKIVIEPEVFMLTEIEAELLDFVEPTSNPNMTNLVEFD